MSTDSRSPELAYGSSPNIEHPGSATKRATDVALAAARAVDKVTPYDPTTGTASGAVVTQTHRTAPLVDLIPAQPVITSPEDEDVITDTTPTVTGTAPAGSTVDLYVDDVLTEEDLTVTDEEWSVTLEELAVGTYDLHATATIDGYTSADSWTITFSVMPAAPVITSPADESTGSDTTPDVVGTAPVGSTVDLYIDDVLTEEDLTVTDDDWSVTLAELALGTYVLTATATLNGLTSALSDEVEFTIEEE